MLKQAQDVLCNMLKAFDEFCTERDIDYWADGGTLLGAVRHNGFIPWDDDIDICMPREDYDKLLACRNELPVSMEFESWHTDDKCFRLQTRIRHRYSKVHETGVKIPKGLFIDVQTFDNYNPDGTLPKGFYLAKRSYDLSTLNRWSAWKAPAKGLKRKLLKVISYILYIPNRFYPQWQVKMFKGKVKKWTDRAAELDTGFFGHGYENNWNVCFRKDCVYPLQRLPFEGFQINAPANTDEYLIKYYGNDYMTPLPESQRHIHYAEIIIDDPTV